MRSTVVRLEIVIAVRDHEQNSFPVCASHGRAGMLSAMPIASRSAVPPMESTRAMLASRIATTSLVSGTFDLSLVGEVDHEHLVLAGWDARAKCERCRLHPRPEPAHAAAVVDQQAERNRNIVAAKQRDGLTLLPFSKTGECVLVQIRDQLAAVVLHGCVHDDQSCLATEGGRLPSFNGASSSRRSPVPRMRASATRGDITGAPWDLARVEAGARVSAGNDTSFPLPSTLVQMVRTAPTTASVRPTGREIRLRPTPITPRPKKPPSPLPRAQVLTSTVAPGRSFASLIMVEVVPLVRGRAPAPGPESAGAMKRVFELLRVVLAFLVDDHVGHRH